MKKRLWSTLLAFCIALTLFPVSASASAEEATEAMLPAVGSPEHNETDTDSTTDQITDKFEAISEMSGAEPDTAAVLSDAGDTMTRGTWMHELVTLFGLTLKKDEYPDVYFPDIAESEYFDDIMVATKYGFVDVEAGDNFEPDEPLTREFAVHTLNFYLGIQNDNEACTFKDADSVNYPDDVQVAVDQGWITLQDDQFHPEAAITEEEAAHMLEQAREIQNGRHSTTSVSDYEFADYVKTIPDSAEIDSDLNYETGVRTLTISGYQDTISEGDTFVCYREGFAFVFTADSVNENDGVFTIVTADPPEDAIVRYEFSGVIQPEISEMIPDEEPVTLLCADGDTVTFGPVELMAVKEYDAIEFKRDVFKSNGVKGSLSGKINNIKLDWSVKDNNKHAILTGDVTATCSVEFDLLDDPAAKNLSLGGVKLTFLGIEIGYVGVELNLKWEAKFGFTYKASFELGVSYENRSGSVINRWNKSNDTCFFADGTISAQLQLSARLHLDPCIYADASIGTGPIMTAGFRQYAGGSPRQCITMSGYLYAGIKIDVKIKDPDKKVIWENPKKSYPIYDEKNSPIRIFTHVEDGVEVPACTRGKDSGTTTGTYQTPKYTTPTNSRYYASGVSNVSSTGYGGYGNAEPVVIWSTSDNSDGTVTVTGYSGNASILNIPETIDGKTVTKIGNNAFQKKTGIRMVSIPDTVTKIGGYAFWSCNNLATIKFSENLTEIGSHAFTYSGLNSIVIPDTITSYNSDIIRGCSKLVSAQLSANVTNIPANMFNGCSSLKSVILPDSVTKIGNNAFKGCASLTDLTWIPNAVTSIGSNTFENCTGLINAELSDLVSSLGGSAFKGCISLTSFKGGANLKTVGANCFQDCAALTDVDLVDGLTTIGNYAFQNCAKLETIALPDSVTSIGTYIFQKDVALKNVTLSGGLKEIPSYAFANCTSLEELTIPGGVTTIKDHAFYQDTKLKTFVIPASVTRIEANAFSYPTTTTVYGVFGSYTETYAKWAAFLDMMELGRHGEMGSSHELRWSYNAGSVSVAGAISENDAMFVVSYDADGKMLSLGTITVSGGSVTPDQSADTIKLIWLDENLAPKCECTEISNS